MTTVGAIVLVAGIIVMLMVIAGMFLLTPQGTVTVGAEGSDGQGSELSPVTSPPPVDRHGEIPVDGVAARAAV